MDKLFVKNEKGELVKATKEQLYDRGIQLFNEDGTEFKGNIKDILDEGKAPNVNTGGDYVKELTGVVTELAQEVKRIKEADGKDSVDLKDKIEEMNSQIAAFKEMQVKGFPLPSSEKVIPEEIKAKPTVLSKVNLAIQGRDLMDKRAYPQYNGYSYSEEKRQEVAKYFCLVYKALVEQSPRAVMEFEDTYAPIIAAERKTVVGDSGNTFPIPDIVESEILAFARERSIVLQYGRVVPMTSEYQSWPRETASASVAWGNTTAESEPTISETQLTAYELSAYAAVRNTTLDDSPSDIVSWLMSNMSESVALELDNVAFNGDGTSTYAGCSGILTAAAGYSVSMGSGSTAFSQITAGKLSEMIAELDGVRKMGARFFMHGEIVHFMRTLVDEQNRPIFVEIYGNTPSTQILGYPYTEVTNMPSTSAVSTAFVAFGNMKYFLVGRRKGVAALQVDPYGLWTTNRTRFKIYSRWGLGMGLATGFVRLITAAS